MSAQTHYEEKLACPVTPGQGCHSWMMSTCNLGALANLSPDEIFADIRRVVHPSRPNKEISDTIKEALRSHGDSNHRGFTAPTRRDVKAVIHDGAAVFNKIVSESRLSTERELIIASPVAIPESPRDQQRLFFETVFQSDDFVFTGDNTKPGNSTTILPACEWSVNGAEGPFVIVNPFSGMPEPKKSGDGTTYRGDACVKFFRHCLIEFDNRTIEEQIRFWSAIKLPVKALIHTGNKSLHAWIDLSGESITSLTQWEKTIKIGLYEQRLKPLGVDMACSNPSRLSRLPGVFRTEKNQWQRLLWLSKEGRNVC
jgi:hypothetical protein